MALLPPTRLKQNGSLVGRRSLVSRKCAGIVGIGRGRIRRGMERGASFLAIDSVLFVAVFTVDSN